MMVTLNGKALLQRTTSFLNLLFLGEIPIKTLPLC